MFCIKVQQSVLQTKRQYNEIDNSAEQKYFWEDSICWLFNQLFPLYKTREFIRTFITVYDCNFPEQYATSLLPSWSFKINFNNALNFKPVSSKILFLHDFTSNIIWISLLSYAFHTPSASMISGWEYGSWNSSLCIFLQTLYYFNQKKCDSQYRYKYRRYQHGN
jgi:hypothetical protein